MKEIEILVELKDEFKKAFEVLSHYEFIGSKETIDYYYVDQKRENLKPNSDNKLMECCRIREKAGKYYVAYKVDIYDWEKWKYSDEYETEVKDIEMLKKIFEKLGLEILVIVDTTKHTFETPDYEIVLEEVKNLGTFLEVEFKQNDSDLRTVDEIKAAIFKFIQDLWFHVWDELNSGKPELMLNKKQH